jgi:hypothetical protein
MAPVMMANAPIRRRRSTFSRKTTQASPMVARFSRLSRSEAEAASVRANPSISNSGPATPLMSTR